MFCFEPLLAMEAMIPTPVRITSPITIQLVSMFCRRPSFQSAASTPPMSKANPKKYSPAHFMAHLQIGSWSMQLACRHGLAHALDDVGRNEVHQLGGRRLDQLDVALHDLLRVHLPNGDALNQLVHHRD